MQGRMLAWIKHFYDLKQAETEKSERAKKHKDMMGVIREVRKGEDSNGNYLSEIRAEIAVIKLDAEKLQHFLYVDDLISFAIILQVIDELRVFYQDETFARLKKLTQDDGVRTYYTHGVSELFKQFDTFLNTNTIDTITCDSIDDFVHTQRRTLSANLASIYHFDVDDISEEFKRDVESDIALSCIHHIFTQSDMRQTAGIAAMTKEFIWLTTNTILNPYISLPHLFACLEPHTKIVGLYQELNAWMKGVHFYHASLLKKELNIKSINYIETADGVILLKDDKPYPPMNSVVDSAMKVRFGLTFYDLARYVHDATKVMTSSLLAVKTEASVLQHSGLFAASSAAAAAAAATVTVSALDPDCVDDACVQFKMA